jgi:hypothetical protein
MRSFCLPGLVLCRKDPYEGDLREQLKRWADEEFAMLGTLAPSVPVDLWLRDGKVVLPRGCVTPLWSFMEYLLRGNYKTQVAC